MGLTPGMLVSQLCEIAVEEDAKEGVSSEANDVWSGRSSKQESGLCRF